MIVDVDLQARPAKIRLRDPYSFNSLSVCMDEDWSTAGLVDAMSGLGTVSIDGDHVFLDIEGLAALGGDLVLDPGWRADFDKMIAFATDRGWVGGGGSTVRAHLEVRGRGGD